MGSYRARSTAHKAPIPDPADRRSDASERRPGEARGTPQPTIRRTFGHRFCEVSDQLNLWSIWGAGTVIAGGMGDDSFHYFRSWLIGKGKAAVDVALTDPDSLGPFIDDTEVDNELLEYTFIEVLQRRGLDRDPREDVDIDLDDMPSGEPFEEDTVHAQYPKLSKQFSN